MSPVRNTWDPQGVVIRQLVGSQETRILMYSDDEIDDAIARIEKDVERRFDQAEFHGPAMAALLDELRRMEAARRNGDPAAAVLFAAAAKPALERYRPTNSTSRSKAVLSEVVDELLAHPAPPPP